jgi:probable biosynthetic protein (TIGR04098 family)
MIDYARKIKLIIPDFDETLINASFQAARIDSMDLLTIRVEFENLNGQQFSDTEWLEFESLSDIIKFCQNTVQQRKEEFISTSEIIRNGKIQINMPQMAVQALSENWLFKELGDMHWNLLCQGLKTKSFLLKDDLDNRLYATFVRIKIESTIPLNEFIENDELELNSSMERFGSGMYFSNISLGSDNGRIRAELMTSFSIRDGIDNTKLTKSQPAASANSISEYAQMPFFGDEYRLIKKGVTTELVLAGARFSVVDDAVFTSRYELNPYYDLNGVGLLYFAAYPIINNFCEAKFFNHRENSDKRWEAEYHVIARDVLYFANCNIEDNIVYVLNTYEFFGTNKVKMSSSLFREKDMTLMARIFTIKVKRNEMA